MLGTKKEPVELVVSLCRAPVPSLIMVTSAPGMAAPVWSSTVPAMDPVGTWAKAGTANKTTRNPSKLLERRMRTPLPEFSGFGYWVSQKLQPLHRVAARINPLLELTSNIVNSLNTNWLCCLRRRFAIISELIYPESGIRE